MAIRTKENRNHMYVWSEAEKAISVSIDEVEKMPANTLLTEAIILLGKAKDKVAEYLEQQN